MSNQNTLKESKIFLLTIAITTLCCISFANAATTPFAQNNGNTNSQVVKEVDKKCGEGKCGDAKKEKAEDKANKTTEDSAIEGESKTEPEVESNKEEQKEESENKTESKCGS